jgi:hypothetical protein
METGVLCMVLRKHRLWHLLEPDFSPMPEDEEVGRALSIDEVNRLLEAAINCGFANAQAHELKLVPIYVSPAEYHLSDPC